MTPNTAPRPLTIWFALVTVYLVWGSTYLAIRVVVESAPPLLAMGARFLLAGALLGAFLAIRRGIAVLRVSWRGLGSAGLVGVLLLLCGNGAVALAEQTVPSGLAALLVAATPLWLVCLRVAAGDRPRALSLAGTARLRRASLCSPGRVATVVTSRRGACSPSSARRRVGARLVLLLPAADARQSLRRDDVGDDHRRCR